MSRPSSSADPWPVQTPMPDSLLTPRPVRRRQPREERALPQAGSSNMFLKSRQIVTDEPAIAQAKLDCMWNSGNQVISCFPTADTVFPQGQWATFVWNSRRPQITQINLVDIFLFRGDSLEQVLHFPNVTNPTSEAGSITAQVNDTWWGDRGVDWNGGNVTYPFFWVIIRSDATLDGSQIPQATFSAVQTTFPDSVRTSMSSTASLASVSSASAASSLSNGSARATTTSPSGGLQSGGAGSSFPHWAIAVIAVLGFLAIVAVCAFMFVLLGFLRKRKSRGARASMGSAAPMMSNVDDPTSPILDKGAAAALLAKEPSSSMGHQDPSAMSHEGMHDGASMASRGSAAGEPGGPFSSTDAAIMAEVFRKTLRKPDFAVQPGVEEAENGDSPEGMSEEQLITRELAEEGRDIRSVGSSRGVRIEAPGKIPDPPT